MDKDTELQAVQPSDEAMNKLRGLNHCIEVLESACELYASRPAFGERDFEIIRDHASGARSRRFLPRFRTVNFSEVWDRVRALASGFQSTKNSKIHPGDRVGIVGFASIDYVIADLACLYLCATSVPLQTGYSAKQFEQICSEAGLSTVVCSLEQVEMVLESLSSCPSVKSLVIMDFCHEEDSQRETLSRVRESVRKKSVPLEVSTLQEVETRGRKSAPVPIVIPKAGENPLMTLCYTSGSTGSPKGAMFPESIWVKIWNSFTMFDLPMIPLITVNYAPLNHVMGRWGMIEGLIRGGLTVFTLKSDMSTLFEDMRIVRPTVATLVPRVSELIYQHFQSEVIRRKDATGGATPTHELEKQIMGEMRHTFLGDRLLYASVGSAPTPTNVLQFLRTCFDVPVTDIYGSTELGLVTSEHKVRRDLISAYKLVDVPELGYRSTDKPYPRGELRVKSSRAIPGYFRNPEATKNLYDQEGFLKTGDIVEEKFLEIYQNTIIILPMVLPKFP